jgi:hypothetical protein
MLNTITSQCKPIPSASFHRRACFSISGNITENKIINSRRTNAQFQELTTPENIDDENALAYMRIMEGHLNLFIAAYDQCKYSYTNTENFIDLSHYDVNR